LLFNSYFLIIFKLIFKIIYCLSSNIIGNFARYWEKGKLNRTKRLREYVYNLMRNSSTNADSINNVVSSDNDDSKIAYDVRRKTIDDLKN
jgi:hypothetical protein